MNDTETVTHDDLDECWCCEGLHDSPKALCPSCQDAGCKHFGEECQSDHKPVVPDGGRAEDVEKTRHTFELEDGTVVDAIGLLDRRERGENE